VPAGAGKFSRRSRDSDPCTRETPRDENGPVGVLTRPGDRLRLLGSSLGALAVVEVGLAVAFTVAVGWSWRDALESFVVTNSVMGVAFAVCGAVIAWHRPSNPIGWLFVLDGLGHATTAAAAPIGEALANADAPLWVQRFVVTAFSWAWPWSIALFLPVALLLFPDGRLPSRRWRPVLWAVVLTAPLFVVAQGAGARLGGQVEGFFTISNYDDLTVLWVIAEVRTAAAIVLAVASLFVRYRRVGEVQRRQLLWLLLASVALLAGVLPWSFVAGTPIAVLFAIPLIPVAVAVAVVRHQLFDIRLVVSRTMAFLLLSAIVVAAYAGLVALLDRLVARTLRNSALPAVIVALGASAALPRLQRMVERAMYGQRRNPAVVASRVGRELATDPDRGLAGVVAAVRGALRMPYAAIVSRGEVVAADGSAPDGGTGSVPLEYGGEAIGELLVGLRRGERELSPADRDVLLLVAAPLATAVHATRLSEKLRVSRERIVATREEERRRLRRDLHDGLGPALTGVAMAADAATNLIERDANRARELLAGLRRDTRGAIADVRRLVEDLRPPDLDQLGLVGALRKRAETLSGSTGGRLRLHVEAPDDLPPLPAAVEMAAYRIATEALTNVVRHSDATGARVELRCGDALELDVIDDAPSVDGSWPPGVGLQAMRERAAELGGLFDAGPTPNGGRVHVSIPVVSR
jgi:two-component system, NarL family, sensor kinase